MSADPASPPNDAYVECESVLNASVKNMPQEGIEKKTKTGGDATDLAQSVVETTPVSTTEHCVTITSELGELLLQHSEIGDWCAVVDNQINEEGEPEYEEAIKKTSTVSKTPCPIIYFYPPFYAYISDVKFSAKQHEIFYFFGGEKNVMHIHMYQNNGNQNLPQGFSGSCMLELKSLESLVEVLKMDGCGLLGRAMNVEFVHPETKHRQRYSAAQLECAELGQKNRGLGRRDAKSSYGNRLPGEGSGRVGGDRDFYRSQQPRSSQNYKQQSYVGGSSTSSSGQPIKYSSGGSRLSSNDVRANQFSQSTSRHNYSQQLSNQSQQYQSQPYEQQKSYPSLNHQRGGNQDHLSSQQNSDSTQFKAAQDSSSDASKPKQDHEQIFGRSKPVDTTNKYLEILKKVEQEGQEDMANAAAYQQEHHQRVMRDHQDVSPRGAGTVNRVPLLQQPAQYQQNANPLQYPQNKQPPLAENFENAPQQQYSTKQLHQQQSYRGFAHRGADQYRLSNQQRGGGSYQNLQKLSDVSDYPSSQHSNFAPPQRQKFQNQQQQWQFSQNRQDGGYSSQKHSESAESSSHREFHNRNYNSRNYDNNSGQNVPAKWQLQQEVLGDEGVNENNYGDHFESGKNTNYSNSDYSSQQSHQPQCQSQNYYGNNRRTGGGHQQHHNYDSESVTSGGGVRNQNRNQRQSGAAVGGGSRTARSESESSTNIRQPKKSNIKEQFSGNGATPLNRQREHRQNATRYSGDSLHDRHVDLESGQPHSGKHGQKHRPQLESKGLAAIKRHIVVQEADGKGNDQQKAECMVLSTTGSSEIGAVLQGLSPLSNIQKIHDSQSRHAGNKKGGFLKQPLIRGLATGGCENVSVNVSSGVRRVYTNRNKDLNLGTNTSGFQGRQSGSRGLDGNVRLTNGEPGQRQLRSDSTPVQLLAMDQYLRKASADSTTANVVDNGRYEASSLNDLILSSSKNANADVQAKKSDQPTQQQPGKPTPTKNKKKATKKQENASVSTKNKYNVLFDAET